MRRVEITRTANIEDIGSLCQHPNVRKLWNLPGDYVLFEFDDPIYAKLDDPASPFSDPTKWTDEIRLYMSNLVDTQRSILMPLYRGRPRHWQGNILFLPLKTTIYRVLDNRKLQWPWFGGSPGWELERNIKVSGLLSDSSVGNQKALVAELAEWMEWASSIGELSNCARPVFAGREFEIQCDFNAPSGDACLALFVISALFAKRTALDAIGFWEPDQTQRIFMRFGASGLMKANGEMLIEEKT